MSKQKSQKYQEFLKTKEDALNFAKTASRYDLFDLIKSACTMRFVQDEAGYKFSKMVRTGKIGLFDYNRGFIDFSVGYVYVAQSTSHFAQLYLATLDDGEMESWREFPTKELAIQFVDKFAEEFLTKLDEFPTLNELNLELYNYGVCIADPLH
jgi:hypothetical protein